MKILIDFSELLWCLTHQLKSLSDASSEDSNSEEDEKCSSKTNSWFNSKREFLPTLLDRLSGLEDSLRTSLLGFISAWKIFHVKITQNYFICWLSGNFCEWKLFDSYLGWGSRWRIEQSVPGLWSVYQNWNHSDLLCSGCWQQERLLRAVHCWDPFSAADQQQLWSNLKTVEMLGFSSFWNKTYVDAKYTTKHSETSSHLTLIQIFSTKLNVCEMLEEFILSACSWHRKKCIKFQRIIFQISNDVFVCPQSRCPPSVHPTMSGMSTNNVY